MQLSQPLEDLDETMLEKARELVTRYGEWLQNRRFVADETLELVLMRYERRRTLCISTEVGCDHVPHSIAEPRAERCEGCGSGFNLRVCAECGHVGCCNDSPNRHAAAHFDSTGHPVIQSFEPGEHWAWCYVDEQAVPDVGVGLARVR